MKKILLATTVLAMSATVAAAEVTLSGDARMGVTTNNVDRDMAFTSRARVKFSMSGETDGGLAFGASFRAADAVGAGSGTKGEVFISGAFGKLTMGDVDSAANALVGNVSGVGLTGLGDANELGYIGNSTDPSVLYTYSADALSVALSVEQPTAGDAKSVAVKYAGEGFAVALGYEDDGTDTQTTVGLSGSVAGMDLAFVAADNSGNADTHYAVSIGYSADALGVTAFYADKGTTSAYGLGASYDLGGGAKVVGGVSKTEGASAVADLGISMSF
jgi:outer membrane protein OmpU